MWHRERQTEMRLDRVFVDLPHDKVRVLLLALAQRLDGGFTAADAEEFSTDQSVLASDDDLLIEPMVLFGGEQLPFVVDVLSHDADTTALVFIVPRVLATLVQEEIRASFGVTPMRVISGESTESE